MASLLSGIAIGLLAAGPGTHALAQTYRDTNLPGRLIVSGLVGDANSALFDMRTGRRTELPRSKLQPDSDTWHAESHSRIVMRWTGWSVGPSHSELAFFDGTTLRPISAALRIPNAISTPRLSPDGRHVITYWHNEPADELSIEDGALTVFDTRTGAVVQRGSRLNGRIVFGNPAVWLPDGGYLYIDGKSLYAVASPKSRDARLVATLDLPGETPTSVQATQISISPDGKRLAFTWNEARGDFSTDRNIWVVNVDGTGLKRLTLGSERAGALDLTHGYPVWSPDSKWVAGILYMEGVVTGTPPGFTNDDPFAGIIVVGTTGCSSQVFVANPDGPTITLAWPATDAYHGLRVFSRTTTTERQWLYTCSGTLAWLP